MRLDQCDRCRPSRRTDTVVDAHEPSTRSTDLDADRPPAWRFVNADRTWACAPRAGVAGSRVCAPIALVGLVTTNAFTWTAHEKSTAVFCINVRVHKITSALAASFRSPNLQWHRAYGLISNTARRLSRQASENLGNDIRLVVLAANHTRDGAQSPQTVR